MMKADHLMLNEEIFVGQLDVGMKQINERPISVEALFLWVVNRMTWSENEQLPILH